MIVPTRLYHGGAAGLSGKLLPKAATGATGIADIFPRSPGALGALQEVLWGPDRVYLTSDRMTARYFACTYAIQHGQPYGTIYKAQPDAELEPDIDTAWSYGVTSATITGVHDPVVLPREWPKIARWSERQARALDKARWLEQFTSDNRAAAIEALNERARARGKAGRPWLDYLAAFMAGDYTGLDETTEATLSWAATDPMQRADAG